MKKTWIRVDIFTASEGLDALGEFLAELGYDSYSITDAADIENLMKGKYGTWDFIDKDLMELSQTETYISLYIPNDDDGQKQLTDIKELTTKLKSSNIGDKLGRLDINTSILQDEDWGDSWRKDFDPVFIGEKLVICPTWVSDEMHDKGKRKTIKIDPGMAFGTGHDDTTSLCLEALEVVVYKDCSVLDIGCGSGILAIGALLLGAGSALGIDIDKTAVKTANDNAILNNVSCDCTFIYGVLNDAVTETYDIICANISTGVILSLLPDLSKYINSNGILILSGITQNREQDVIHALLASGFTLLKTTTKNEWVCIMASRE